jgi:nucleotide-binding universal stress UspA family protein
MSDVISKVLVPTDFSESADAAVNTAASLAKKFSSKLILLHIIDLQDFGDVNLKSHDNGTSLEEIATNLAKDRLATLGRSPSLQGVNLEVKIRVGKVYNTILGESQEESADLIVMGTHGLTALEKLLIGSNAKRIVQLSQVPVLVVKEDLLMENVKSLVFASNFNQEYTLSFPKVFQFMELFGAKIHFLKVITPGDFEPTAYSQKIIKDFAASFMVTDYQHQIVNAYSIEEGIQWYCQEYDIDMVFMATHGRRGFSHFLSGSHTETLGIRSPFPVFSIKMIKAKTPRGVIFPD